MANQVDFTDTLDEVCKQVMASYGSLLKARMYTGEGYTEANKAKLATVAQDLSKAARRLDSIVIQSNYQR